MPTNHRESPKTLCGPGISQLTSTQILENSDAIESLEEQSQAMSTEARAFKSRTQTVNRFMQMRNLKLNLIIAGLIGGILAFFGFVIFLFVVRFRRRNGTGDDDDEDTARVLLAFVAQNPILRFLAASL